MAEIAVGAPIVVGVDGSQAALNAAIWAVDEAVCRDVPLRMVHVISVDEDSGEPTDQIGLEVEYGESSLRTACAAVTNTAKPVKIETEIVWGAVGDALLDESRDAAMICVGSVGVGAVARKLLGSTACEVAENAYCPVAVIRTPLVKPAAGAGWIAVVVDKDADNDRVVEFAMEEARLRAAPLLAVGVSDRYYGETTYDELDRRVEAAKRRHPEVDVRVVATRGGMAAFLAHNRSEPVQLAVVGRADAYVLAEILGPHSHPVRRMANARCWLCDEAVFAAGARDRQARAQGF